VGGRRVSSGGGVWVEEVFPFDYEKEGAPIEKKTGAGEGKRRGKNLWDSAEKGKQRISPNRKRGRIAVGVCGKKGRGQGRFGAITMKKGDIPSWERDY